MSLHISEILIEGASLSLYFCVFVLGVLYYNPRLMLNDYPKSIRLAVSPRTAKENKQFRIVGTFLILTLISVPFISILQYEEISFGTAFLHLFMVYSIISLVDLIILDWVIFCCITPKFLVIPGTNGMKDYQNYFFHAIAFLKGNVIYGVVSVLLAGLRVLLN